IHGLTVPGAIEIAQRKKGFTNGLFEWLRKAPWGNPVFSGVFISIVTFGFIGGITGVVMGTEQINLIIHNTLYVPGHFHATVVLGTTLTFMALTYFLIPVLFRREMIMPGLAKWQPYLFGGGMIVFTLVMMGAGTLGVPRRHWDVGFAQAAEMGLKFEFPGSATMMLGLVGVSAVIAVLGGIIFILITVGSIVWGKKIEKSAGLLQSFGMPLENSCYTSAKLEPLKGPAADLEEHGSSGFEAPGTFVLALVLLVTFVVYYFINWKYLSSVWPMG
ncbi:MAG: cbb3-type cytochrome c oxidase subunit I, partial [Proteobacteria bacterium]|nr:cbb3-type cytochrome c oxidase subunit I [Pseudomonadota bacterium]